MHVDKKPIKTFEELHRKIRAFGQDTIYRGVKDHQYDLRPKIGRPELGLREHWSKIERGMLERFKARALPHIAHQPRNDWEWLALAQHHGLPTRLLDWTRNPLVAAYFAVEKRHSGDSAIYVMTTKSLKTVKPSSVEKGMKNPFEYRKFRRVDLGHLDQRIIAQDGLFTFHPDPEKPLETNDLHKGEIQKVVIANSFRGELKKILNKYGINRQTLFPGLDALAYHLKWRETQINGYMPNEVSSL